RNKNNICQEKLSMEILETQERKMNKNKEKKTYTLFRDTTGEIKRNGSEIYMYMKAWGVEDMYILPIY
ncbi:hypothetical protein SD211_05995, partial [Prevotella intermedia]